MDRRGGHEGVDAALAGMLHGVAAAVDIGVDGAGEACDHRVPGALGDLADGLEVAVGGDRKAGFDDVDTHVVEDFGDLQLFFQGHGGAGRLFAVAQGGVEDADLIFFGSHSFIPSRGSAALRAGFGWCSGARSVCL